MHSSASSLKGKDVEHNLVLNESRVNRRARVGLINILLLTYCSVWLAVLHVVLTCNNVSRNEYILHLRNKTCQRISDGCSEIWTSWN